jgi:hypothetical protein
MFRSFRFSIFAIAVSTISAQTPAREVAITFDDLPIAGVLPRDLEASRELTRKLRSSPSIGPSRILPIGRPTPTPVPAASPRSTAGR